MRLKFADSLLIATVALVGVLSASAQQQPQQPQQQPPTTTPQPSQATYPSWMVRSNGSSGPVAEGKLKAIDPKVYKTDNQVPPPEAPGDSSKLPLPTGPIEPYLLQPENGPFMVNAYVFRDPNASRLAQMLAMELRKDYDLPAYVFYLKVIPGNSYIRNIPPTAPPPTRNGEITAPERFRMYDEAAVLVGNCKTTDESLALLKVVKKIRPKCLNNVTGPFSYLTRKGLGRAMMTQNPLVPSQVLFPGRAVVPVAGVVHGEGNKVAQNGQSIDLSVVAANFEKNKKPDPMVKKINDGPHNIYQCPAPYTLQVATFSGHATTFLPGQMPDSQDHSLFSGEKALKKSPLMQAADDAESFAEALDHCPILKAAGYRVYVYHDRSSSRVTLGAFHTEHDQRAEELRKLMPRLTEELGSYAAKMGKKDIVYPVPSTTLMPVPRS